ncbi:MAG: Maf family protein [Treponemataceae bacterium]|nr:Maf family protein [Treponemataceae bacterium]
MDPIILASSSPRRQEILKSLNIPFKVIIPDIKETFPDDIAPEKAPEYIATKKVEAIIRTIPVEQTIPWILGADTVIVLEGKLYGKPGSREEAGDYLRAFSGKTHKVITSIAVFNGQINYLDTRTNISTVTFKNLTEEEINWYLDSGEWYGVAGGYRMQGKAAFFITEITGSYSSIVGLPISDFYDIMTQQNYPLRD